LTRERAQELADEVLRGAERRAAQAGRGMKGARDRQRDAATGVGERLREAIAEIRGLAGEGMGDLRSEVESLRRRVDALEREVRRSSAPARRKPQAGTRGTRSTTKPSQGKTRKSSS
jgi:polyhydroxyalkanoate synthesis regulator phasin